MSQILTDPVTLRFGVILPCIVLIGVWAFHDVLRIRGMIKRGEV